jgi:serine/threonine protein kinase
MEFIQGKNLSDLIPQDLKEEIPYKRIATFIFQCATALDYIHKMHIIHRDIKPSNIMIKEGDQAVLIDFGIAKEATQIAVSEELMDRTFDRSHVKGSPAYMSPEQFRLNQSIDARTDIYSLGVTFYQLLTGNLPLQGGMTTLGQKASHWMPADPRNINPKIPAPLEMIILKAMEKDKKNRYTYASEMAEDLQLWLHDKPIRSAQLSTLQRWKRRLKRLTQYFWRSSSSSSSPPPSA